MFVLRAGSVPAALRIAARGDVEPATIVGARVPAGSGMSNSNVLDANFDQLLVLLTLTPALTPASAGRGGPPEKRLTFTRFTSPLARLPLRPAIRSNGIGHP